jgi:hypothetical protein
MKEYYRIELDIDWEDRPMSLPHVIPGAPGVPAQAGAPEGAPQTPAASEQVPDLDDDLELIEEESSGTAEVEVDKTDAAPEPVKA